MARGIVTPSLFLCHKGVCLARLRCWMDGWMDGGAGMCSGYGMVLGGREGVGVEVYWLFGSWERRCVLLGHRAFWGIDGWWDEGVCIRRVWM